MAEEIVMTDAPVEAPSPTSDLLGSMTEAQRAEWRKTGELPAPPAAEGETAAQAENPPAPEAGKPQETRKESGAEKRIKQLLAQKKELQAKLDAVQQQTYQPPVAVPPKTEEKKAETIEGPAKPTPGDVNLDGSPKWKDYEQFAEALAEWKADQVVGKRIEAALKQERENQAKAVEQARIEQTNRAIEAEWNKRVVEATKKHSDFKEVALNPEFLKTIPKGSVLDAWTLKYADGPEVLYSLAKMPEAMEHLNSLDPLDQAAFLFEVRQSLSANGEEAHPPAPAPQKATSNAPPPPTELTAKATPVLDEAQAALQRGDFTAYRRAVNARELASRKG